MLQVKHLEVSVRNGEFLVPILQDVNFSLEKREKMALVGVSGSGKTTLLESITALNYWNSNYEYKGQINFEDKNLLRVGQPSLQNVRGKDIAYLFQEPMACFNPLMAVGKQLLEGYLRHNPVVPAEAKEKIYHWLVRVGLTHTDRIFKSYPHELSGGQLQRVMMVLSLMNHPKILLADEPTSALDEDNVNMFLDLTEEERGKNNMAIIMVTHDFTMAKHWADTIMVLHDGRIVEKGSKELLVKEAKHPFTKALLNFDTTRENLRKKIQAQQTGKEPDSNRLVLSLNSVYKSFKNARITGDVQVLNNITFDLPRGKSLGITGPSGCGKTTLGKCIVKLLEIDKGQLIWMTKDVTQLDFHAVRPWRHHVQIVFQDTSQSLPPHLTIRQILAESIRQKKNKHTPESLLHDVGLDPLIIDRYPKTLSGGQRQRVCLARALAFEPDLLVMDEMISMLDPITQVQIMDLLLKWQQEKKLSYIFISHDKTWLHVLTKNVLTLD